MKLSLTGRALPARQGLPESSFDDADVDWPAGPPRTAGGEYVKLKLNVPLTHSQSVLPAQRIVSGDIEGLPAGRSVKWYGLPASDARVHYGRGEYHRSNSAGSDIDGQGH